MYLFTENNAPHTISFARASRVIVTYHCLPTITDYKRKINREKLKLEEKQCFDIETAPPNADRDSDYDEIDRSTIKFIYKINLNIHAELNELIRK